MKEAFEDNKYGAYFDQQMAHVNHLLEVCKNLSKSNEIKSYLLTCKSAYIGTKTSEANVVYLYAKEAIELLEETSISAKAEAIIRGQYANALKLKGEYDLSLKEYMRVLEIDIATLGSNHKDTAATYNNIGLIYDDKGEYDLALEKYEKSLKIKMATVGENHPDTASTYNNIGLVYTNKGEYDLALEKYDKSLKIKMATVGENHPDTATTYNNIGLVYTNKGEYDLALEKYEKSLKSRWLL